jgi:hypothetical protein
MSNVFIDQRDTGQRGIGEHFADSLALAKVWRKSALTRYFAVY